MLVQMTFTEILRPMNKYIFLKKKAVKVTQNWNHLFIRIHHKLHILTSIHICLTIAFKDPRDSINLAIIECRNYTLGVFCARGEAEGCKTHRGFNFYSILRQQTHFECPKRSWGHLTCKSDTFLCLKMF